MILQNAQYQSQQYTPYYHLAAIMRFSNSISILIAIALSLNCQGGRTAGSDDVSFPTEYLEIAIGREALEEARSKIDVEAGNTFTIHNNPAANTVLVQEYDADTN